MKPHKDHQITKKPKSFRLVCDLCTLDADIAIKPKGIIVLLCMEHWLTETYAYSPEVKLYE